MSVDEIIPFFMKKIRVFSIFSLTVIKNSSSTVQRFCAEIEFFLI